MRDSFEKRQFRFAFDHRDDGLLVILPDDGVGFPIANATLLQNERRALADTATALDLASALIRAVAFASLFAAAQVLMKLSAHCFVRIDILIDALMADALAPFFGEPTGDLFRTPVLAHAAFN